MCYAAVEMISNYQKNHRHKRTKSNINSRNKGWCWSIQLLAVVFFLSLSLSPFLWYFLAQVKKDDGDGAACANAKDAMNIMLKSKTPWLCKQMNSFDKTFAAHKSTSFVVFEHDLASSKYCSLCCTVRYCLKSERKKVIAFNFAMGKKWKCVWLVPKKKKFNQKITVWMI